MISAVILTKNNEQTIAEALDSVSWCDERIVLDDYSTDNTLRIAKKKNARVINRKLENNFSDQRNAGLKHAQGDWVLFLDSDEIVPSQLAEEIKKVVSSNTLNGWYLFRQDMFMGKKLQYGETAHVRLLRLAKKNTGIWKGSVHEVWDVKEPVGQLKHPLLHKPHPTMTEFLSDINRYSSLVADERLRMGRKTSVWEIVLYPFAKCIQNYVVRQGYKDGMQGAIVAFMMSFHSFLVRSKMFTKEK